MYTITVTFRNRLANLYDVGYLSIDIFQLIAFAEALVAGDEADVERWFGEKSRPFNRFAGIMEKSAEKSRISDVRNGSVELVVECASAFATVMVSLLVPFVQHKIDNRTIEFSIEVDDIIVKRALEAYAGGAFGGGPHAIDRLSDHLARHDRNVFPRGNNAYTINRVLERYSTRVVRTLRRP